MHETTSMKPQSFHGGRTFQQMKITQLTKCKIRQKQQWINTAQSIINRFRENLHSNPQARTMWRAMNLIQTEQTQTQHNQHENDNQGNQNIEDGQANDNERKNNLEHALNHNDNKTAHDNTDESEDTDNNSTNSNDNLRNTQLHDIKNKNDKNDENDQMDNINKQPKPKPVAPVGLLV